MAESCSVPRLDVLSTADRGAHAAIGPSVGSRGPVAPLRLERSVLPVLLWVQVRSGVPRHADEDLAESSPSGGGYWLLPRRPSILWGSRGRGPERGGEIMRLHRRAWLGGSVGGFMASGTGQGTPPGAMIHARDRLTITGLTVTPIALPDPPLLASSGCHGPYFLRNVVELKTNSGVVGLGETHGGEGVTAGLEKAREIIVGQNALAYRKFALELQGLGMAVYAGIELACLDACGRATGRRLCEMIGGPVRESVEFAAYLFYRYAADHPVILADPHLVDVARPRRAGPRRLGRGPLARGDGRDGRPVPRPLGLPRLQAQGRRPAPRGRARYPLRNGRAARAGRTTPDRPQRSLEDRHGDPDRQGDRQAPDGILRGPRRRPGGHGRGPSGHRAEDEHEYVRDPVRAHPRGHATPSDRRPALRPSLLRRVRRLPGAWDRSVAPPAGRSASTATATPASPWRR